MEGTPRSYICAMQFRVKNKSYEVYWNGSRIVPFLDQAKIYLSRPEAQAVSAALVNKRKLLFYAKELS